MTCKNIAQLKADAESLRHKMAEITNTEHLYNGEVMRDNFVDLRSAMDYVKLVIEELKEIIV
jgi:hypothetical protein